MEIIAHSAEIIPHTEEVIAHRVAIIAPMMEIYSQRTETECPTTENAALTLEFNWHGMEMDFLYKKLLLPKSLVHLIYQKIPKISAS